MTLIERERELEVLSRALADARRGAGGGVAICGEPGIGKSVLVAAACRAATGLRVLVQAGQLGLA